MNERGGYPERIIRDDTAIGIVTIHLKRYEFARPYCMGKRVLDVACGVGYGAHYLARGALQVVGVDIDPEAITYARRRYGDLSNLSFIEGDATALKLRDHSFDVVCSFETIEHLADVQAYLREVQRVLVPKGLYIVSTPVVPHSTRTPSNPHHYQEWSPEDFRAVLLHYFSHIELFSQTRRETAVAVWLRNWTFLS